MDKVDVKEFIGLFMDSQQFFQPLSEVCISLAGLIQEGCAR